ncbi:hypothetical protein BJY00DRAFT_313690 [Aspergillus carlsbadensis]|nr:hypothetical protein BJY00DRAFT_313690 [Aspergillus carlsbadensis]
MLQLDKCMLITPGSSFAPDQRQKTGESVFGTLAICLPSKYDGGDIVVSDHGQSHTFRPSSSSDSYAFACAAWSISAEPVGQPVTSGYQLILRYRLIHRPTSMALKYRDEGATSLTELLSSWSKWAESKTTEFQTDGLKDRYDMRKIGFNGLSGRDERQIAQLLTACDSTGCRVFLAEMVQQIEGTEDERRPERRLPEGVFSNIGKVTCHDFGLHRVIDVGGRIVVDGQVTRKELCAYDTNTELTGAPKEEFPMEETSDGRDVINQSFSHGIAIVIPPSFYFPFLLNAASQLRKDRLIYNINQMSELCTIVAADLEWRKVLFDEVVWVALEIGNFEAAKRCLSSRGEQAELWARRFGKVIYTQGIERVQPVIDHLWSLLASSPTGHIMSLVNMRATWTDPSAQRTPAKAMAWYEHTLHMLFDRLEGKGPVYLEKGDGTFLAVAVRHFPESFFDARVVSFATKVTPNTDIIVAFLASVYKEYEKGVARDKLANLPTAYAGLVPAILQNFSIFSRRFPQYPNTYKDDYFINGYHLSWFIEQTRTLGLDMTEVLTTLERQITESPKQYDIFPVFTTQIVRLVCENLRKKHHGDVSAAAASEEGAFVIRLVKSYITQNLGRCPTVPSDWRQSIPKVKPDCCPDCAELARFVEDPVEQQKDFCMIARRRIHIENKLEHHFVYYTVADGTPHMLRIIKTHDRASERRLSWKERAARQRKELEAVDKQVLLRESLGEDAYREIYACVADPDTRTASDPVQSNGGPSTLSELRISHIQAWNRLRPPPEQLPSPGRPAIPRKRKYSDLVPDPDDEENLYTPRRW